MTSYTLVNSDWLGVAIKLLGLLKGQGCPDRRAVGTYTYVDRLRVCFIWFRYILWTLMNPQVNRNARVQADIDGSASTGLYRH